MSCDNLPTTAEIEQAKKDVTDFNTFMTSTSDTFVDSNGVHRSTLTGTINKIDWSYVGLFADGVTFTDKMDFAVDAVGTQWIYTGSLPFSATAGTVPSEPTYQVVHVRSASAISNANGGSVQDFIDNHKCFTETLLAPVAPTDIIFNASNFEIEARPVLLGQGLETTFFEFAIDSESPIRGKGQTFVFTGLNFGTEYTVFARTVNALGVSDWFSKEVTTTADSSQIIDLIGDDIYESVFEPVVSDLQNQVNEAVSSIEELDTDLKLRISSEKASRVETDKALFDTAASAVQLRQDLSNGLSGLTDAVFEVNPDTGLINLRAYSYTDAAFSQAGILIDGVAAEVDIQAERVTVTEQRITTAESQILVQAGQIGLKASYTEVNEIVAGAIDAVLPAYSFGFFNSSEGWSAVNGTLTSGPSKLTLTLGDIENQALSYSADENPLISISIERLAGTGWVGDLIVNFDSAPDQTYSGVILPVDAGGVIVRNLNLSGESTYTGTVTGIRFKFGASASDTFELSSVTIGKPSASQESLESLTSQVNQLGVEIDAVESSLTNYVTTTFYETNSVTFNNLDVTLDGADAIISLKATQQELDSNGTLTKANDAAIWIDASEANITQVVSSYNAQAGGINDQISGLNDQYNIVQSEIDASAGLIRDQSVSINRLGNKDRDVEQNAFYAATQLLNQKNGLLAVGDAVAIADRQLQTVANDVSALSQEILQLEASFGTEIGQINAEIDQALVAIATAESSSASAITSLEANINDELSAQSVLIQEVNAKADGTANSLAALSTDVTNLEGDVAESQLILNSTVDELGVVSARAFLGTSTVVDGVAVVNGIVVDGASNALEFRANTLRLTDTDGVDQLVYDNATDTWKFFGTVYVERLIGDVVELYGLELASVTFNNNVKRERLATFTIASAPFQRNLVINPLQFTLGGQSALKLELYIGDSVGGVFYQGQTIKNNHLVSSLYQDEVSVSSKPFYIDVTANTPLTLTLAITDIGIPSGYRGVGGTSSGKTSMTLARSGSSFSRSFPL